MTADEISSWVEMLSAAADPEERGRQARMGAAASSGALGGTGSGTWRGGRGGAAAGFGMASWRGHELQSAKTGKGAPRPIAAGNACQELSFA
jgi:hypothetical protein